MKGKKKWLSGLLFFSVFSIFSIFSWCMPVQAASEVRINKESMKPIVQEKKKLKKESPSLKRSDTICIGKEQTLKVKGTAKKVTWTSSKPKVVKVNQKGRILGLKKGTAIITATVGKKKLNCKVTVKNAVVQVKRVVPVKNATGVTLLYFSDEIFCESSNPKIASVMMTKGGPAEDGSGYEADLVVFGHENGKALITVTNNCNQKKMQFEVEVKRPKQLKGYEQMIDAVIRKGELDSNGLKYITKKYDDGAEARISYDYWEDALEYEYRGTAQDAQVRWLVLDADNPELCYFVMWITPAGIDEEHYVTTAAVVYDYKGEELPYEVAWYRIPVEQWISDIANEITRTAHGRLGELIKEYTGLSWEQLRV